MIDLHSHILPGIDDGAPTLEVSVQMLHIARRNGFRTIVATPHLPGRLSGEYRQRVTRVYYSLSELAGKMDIEILLGFEVSLTQDLDQRLAEGEPITLAGSTTVLVDVPFVGWPLHAEQSFFELQAAGYRPLLAHPERYEEIQKNPERALELAERGVLLQVTTGSFAGIFGRAAQRTAELLLESNAVHVVASDAHSAGQRFMAVEAGLARLRELAGSHGVERLTTSNPRALLSDKTLEISHSTDLKTAVGGLRKVFQRLTKSFS